MKAMIAAAMVLCSCGEDQARVCVRSKGERPCDENTLCQPDFTLYRWSCWETKNGARWCSCSTHQSDSVPVEASWEHSDECEYPELGYEKAAKQCGWSELRQ